MRAVPRRKQTGHRSFTSGRTDGRFRNLSRGLAWQLATAHRLTVPPDGERTIIVVAVASLHHLFALRAVQSIDAPAAARQEQVARPVPGDGPVYQPLPLPMDI